MAIVKCTNMNVYTMTMMVYKKYTDKRIRTRGTNDNLMVK